MSWLIVLWDLALVVTVGELLTGAVRTLAYRSGDLAVTRTQRRTASVSTKVGLVGLGALALLSLLMLVV